MNLPRLVVASRLLLVAGLVAASAAAQASGVYWSVNVNAPVQDLGYVSTSVSNSRHGVYVQPAPVYQVYDAPRPVVYTRPATYCPPRQVVYQPVRYVETRGPRGRSHHHGEARQWRHEHHEPMMRPYGGDRDERHHGW